LLVPDLIASTFDMIAASKLRVAAVHALLGLVAYAVVLNAPLFFDDYQFVEWNTHVTEFDLDEIYSSSVTEGSGFQSNTYRPNQQLVYAVLYKFFGLTPAPYHVFSLLVHLVNTMLVFLLLTTLQLQRTGCFLASLVFLLHPIQTESVSYVSGLAGPFALAFLLAGMHAWIASLFEESPGRRAGLFAVALALFVGAFFTKSNMVILAPLCLCLGIYFVLSGRIQTSRYLVLSVACFFALAGGFFAVKLTLLNFTGDGGMVAGHSLYTDNLYVRLFTFISVLDRYVEMMLWPAVQSYGKPRIWYSSLFTIHGAAGLVAIAVAILALVRARKAPLAFLGFGWFFAALAPFSGMIPLTSMYLEHWLYVPLIGPLILLAGLFDRLDRVTPELRNRVAAVALSVLLILTARTVVRNYEWADAERFYQAELRNVGVTMQMLNNLALHLEGIGKTDAAIEAFKVLIKYWDSEPEPHANLGQIYLKRGDFALARTELLLAIEIDPGNRDALITLRDLYDVQGAIEQATKLDRRIREIERDRGL
jgi:hypothetical protein